MELDDPGHKTVPPELSELAANDRGPLNRLGPRRLDNGRRRIGEDDSAALAVICEAYADGPTALTPDSLVETLADYLSGLDADERANFRAAVNARVTPSRRHGPAKGLFIEVEVVQPAGFGAESSSRPDAGPYASRLSLPTPLPYDGVLLARPLAIRPFRHGPYGIHTSALP